MLTAQRPGSSWHRRSERYPICKDLALHITHPDSVWTTQGLERPNYVAKMIENPERAEQFTRMLYELHLPLAEQLANFLDLTGVNRIMDLGGGSGVISHTLLRRYSHLSSVVVDIPNVCVVGREIARETTVRDRITYHAADFLHDDLPIGFDMIIECDIGIYSEELFRKVYNSLNEGGKFVIVGGHNRNKNQIFIDPSGFSLLRLRPQS